MKRLRLLVLVATAIALLSAASASTRGVKEGGTFRIAGGPQGIDPALFPDSWSLRPACGTLLTGVDLRPELAEAEPVVSQDGRTYTFTVRKDARFSTGAPVTALAFARALARIRDPALESYLAFDFQDVREVVPRGRTLRLKLAKRMPQLPILVASLCAVPPNLPADPEGAKAPLPSPAPYYVSEYVSGERLVLERNRFYKGNRTHHVDRYVSELAVDPGSMVDEVARGTFDSADLTATTAAARAAELARRYGVNKGQFWVAPGDGLRLFFLNTSQPLFRKNPKLRQAVNFAIDRRALTRELGPYGGRATDQYLLPVMPGFRDERIYPLKAPDLSRARRLARGHLRSRKAVLYTPSLALPLSTAQIVQRSLGEIGLEVDIKPFPPQVYGQKTSTPGEPYDIGYAGFSGLGVRDPSFLHCLFEGPAIDPAIGEIGCANYSYFDSSMYNRLLDKASRLTGAARYRAYSEVDLRLSRDAAPAIPWAVLNATEFVSARVGCVVMNPGLDLTAVCLK